MRGHPMNVAVFRRYIGAAILQATVFVMCAFLAMFLFFDFLAEIDEIGIGGYRIEQALLQVLLGVPNRVVELAPIAALIGTLWALSQSAAQSEFTVFRVSGLLPSTALGTILRIGLPLVIITALFSEILVPLAEDFRGRIRDGASAGPGQMRSGLWLRDSSPAADRLKGGTRFINAGRYSQDQSLESVRVYDFDNRQRLVATIESRQGRYLGLKAEGHTWELLGVRERVFDTDGSVRQRDLPQMQLVSQISPEMLGALIINPDRMSSIDLYRYVAYLKQNKQQSDRYEIAFWKRLVYPLVVWVMMLLALPVAYLQARAGTVGTRVFAGILVGVGFHLLNSLFSHLGVLNTWPAPVMAMLPSLMALMVAGIFFYRVQRV